MGIPTESEHSVLGPSSWPRWIRCPGSVKAQEGHEDRKSFEAAEGSVFHELMADCLEFGFEPEDLCGEGNGLEIDGYFIEYNEDMCRYGRDGLDYVREIEETPGWVLFVETRVDISDYALPGQFGTADVILVNVKERKVIVFDWKYGFVPVFPKKNYQLNGYALGAWKTLFGELFEWDDRGIEVEFIIWQPRVPGAGGSWNTNMSDVLAFGEVSRQAAEQTMLDDPPRHAGEKQCEYCRAQPDCEEWLRWSFDLIGLEFDDLDEEETIQPEPIKLLTPERRSNIIKAKPRLVKWLNEVYEDARHDAMSGGETPGLKIVLGRRPNRKYAADTIGDAEFYLKDELGDEAYHEPKLISPAQAEKKLGKPRYLEDLAKYVEQGDPVPTLVSIDDSRPAIESAVDMFNDLDA